MDITNFTYEGVKLERGEDCFEPSVIYMHPFPPLLSQLFYLRLFNSVAIRKLILVRKNIWAGGQLPPPHTLSL